MLKKMFLATGFLAVSQFATAQAEFIAAPIEVSKNCDAVILKGTKRFEGVGYVLPKVFLSIKKNRDKVFTITPMKNGSFLLRFTLFTPMNASEAIAFREADSQYMLHDCDFNQIKSVVDKKDPKSAGKGINSLSMLPINKMVVSIDGVAQRKTIGNGTAILDYQRRDSLVEFVLPNQAALDEFLARYQDEVGVSVNVEMFFSARRSQGLVKVHIDTKELHRKLSLSLGAAGKVLKINLAAEFAKHLKDTNMDVYIEGGDESLREIANGLIEKYSERLTPTSPESVKSDVKKGEVDLKGFYSRLTKEENLDFNYQLMGEEETASYLTSTMIQGTPGESNHYNLRNDGVVAKPLPIEVKAGQTWEISVVGKTTETLLRMEKVSTRMLGVSEVMNLKREYLRNYDEDNGPFSWLWEIESEKKLGVTKDGSAFLAVKGRAFTLDPIFRIFMWGIETLEPVFDLGKRQSYEIGADPKNLPLMINFSEVKKERALHTLVKPGTVRDDAAAWFTVTYDAFREVFVVKAKRNLGYMSLRNDEKEAKSNYRFWEKASVTERAFEKYYDGRMKYWDTKSKSVPRQQSIFTVNVERQGGSSGSYSIGGKISKESGRVKHY